MPTIDMSACGCCGGTACECFWEWSGTVWVRLGTSKCNECPTTTGADPGCENQCCLPPMMSGTFVGELAQTACLEEGGV